MKKIFGPYRGSEANGGRPIYVFKRKKKDGTVATTSSNKARVDYEESTGKTLPRGTEVDHKTTKVEQEMTECQTSELSPKERT